MDREGEYRVRPAAVRLLSIPSHRFVMGYREYRSRRIAQPLMACLVLSLGYLLTASLITAMGGHVFLHLAMLRRGMELPPHGPGSAQTPPEREREPASTTSLSSTTTSSGRSGRRPAARRTKSPYIGKPRA